MLTTVAVAGAASSLINLQRTDLMQWHLGLLLPSKNQNDRLLLKLEAFTPLVCTEDTLQWQGAAGFAAVGQLGSARCHATLATCMVSEQLVACWRC
eukprot:1715064-Amphidinium_carterae.1